MANIHARTYSIALVLGGVFIIAMSIYAFEFGIRGDTIVFILGLIIGVSLALASIPVYLWEREKYYQDKKDVHL